MSSVWGNSIKISIFGESHGKAIGVTVHNLPSGIKLDFEAIKAFLARRAAGRDEISSQRKEEDMPEIISGFYNGCTTGTPLTALIYNKDIRSGDYDSIENLVRPSHADYSGNIKYKGFNDIHGGGHFSARLTAPLVFAGAIACQILEKDGIYIGAHIKSIAGVEDDSFNPLNVSVETLNAIKKKDFPIIDDGKGVFMKEAILQAKNDQDSVGGIIECIVTGLAAGIGSPIFDGIENVISSIIFGIPAVKGIEFGLGFAFAGSKGSEANDEMYIENGKVKSYSNNNGGVLGGISNGLPIIFRTAMKPTPSIAREQRTINLTGMENAMISIKGRHDPCIVKRAVPCIEAAAALAILDLYMGAK